MSLSDLLNISRTTRRDQARQQDLLSVPTTSKAASIRLCNICYAQPAAYNCPRCNIPFCSLVCFRRSEHQECSAAFSSSVAGLTFQSDEDREGDADRKKVADILRRLEGNEREARVRQQDAEEDEEEDDSSDEDEHTKLRADLNEEQIEGASTVALLAMLTPKERRRFLDAVKSEQSASALMARLDRKADRRARLQSSEEQQSILIASQALMEQTRPNQLAARRNWQSLPWFESPEACPSFAGRPAQHASTFVATLEKILAAARPEVPSRDTTRPVNLLYNLCATLMAYAYTLRHLDAASLSDASASLVAGQSSSQGSPMAKSAPSPLERAQSLFDAPRDSDDDEPPPLEPDEPTIAAPPPPVQQLPPPPSLPEKISPSLLANDMAAAEQALDILYRMVPFLFSEPTPATKRSSLPVGGNDPSKLVLASLDDASMWLLSHLSLESDLGQGGADAIDLQLSEDLDRLLDAQQLIPTFHQDDKVEPKYRLASRLAALPPQQAFAAAQTPLLLNAVADLYFFLEDLATFALTPSSQLRQPHVKAKGLKLAQRKLCFYVCSAVLADQATIKQSSSRLRQEVQDHVHTLQRRIKAAEEADKLAAAVSSLNKDA